MSMIDIINKKYGTNYKTFAAYTKDMRDKLYEIDRHKEMTYPKEPNYWDSGYIIHEEEEDGTTLVSNSDNVLDRSVHYTCPVLN